MGEVRGANEPCRWEVVNSALEGIVDREKFIEINQQARQICANKHAYDEDQYVGELKVLGLKYYNVMRRVQLFLSPVPPFLWLHVLPLCPIEFPEFDNTFIPVSYYYCLFDSELLF